MTDIPANLTSALSDRYRIERELGAGGMATVYLADDLKHGRKVAIKVLRPELAAVVGGERFLSEIRTTAQLQHPNILPLFDSGEADGFLFYVMPYVEGESLREKLDREKQLRVEDAIGLVRKIGDALDYAHEQGVVHRDIKPANIMLSGRGEPLVADFGIALAVSQAGGGRITETGLSLGTPHYMSPEQATGDRDVDPRSDIYALGCVLYELLAGQPPFAAPTAQAVLARILTEQPRRITELRRTVPPHVASVLDQALEKLPADRFESAKEFLDALDDPQFEYETQMVPVPMRSTGGHRSTPASSRRSPLVPALAAGLVLAVAAAAVGWLRAMPEPPSAPVTRTLLSDFPTDAPAGSGERLAISRDGSKIAAVVYEDGARRLYWRRTSELERTWIEGADFPGRPGFSPDGQWLVFEDGGMIRRVELAGGPVFPVVEGDSPHWGMDDLIVFRNDGGLYMVAPSGGEPTLLFADEAGEIPGGIERPYLLPDGSGVLFQAGQTDETGDRLLYLYESESGEVVDLGLRGANPNYVASGHLVFGYQAQSLGAVPFDLRTRRPTGQATTVLLGVTVYGGGATQFVVSDNGTAFYEVGGSAAGGGAEVLTVVGFDGQEEPAAVEVGNYGAPRWSPDGRSVAYYGRPSAGAATNIYTYEVDLRRAPRQRTFDGFNWDPIWSPDGTRVVFTSERSGTDDEDLFVQNLTTDEPPRPLATLPGDQVALDWPADDVIVFLNDDGGTQSFRIIDPTEEGATPTVYLESNLGLGPGDVSPEGTRIAYMAQENSQATVPEIYVRSFPDDGQPARVSYGGGVWPRWSPDGRTLWYWAFGVGTDGTLLAATVDAGAQFAVVRTDTVGTFGLVGGETDIHPDGDRLITLRDVSSTGEDEEAPPAQALLVTNWFTELERLTGGAR